LEVYSIKNIPSDVFKLDKNKNIAIQALQLFGWHTGRRINIESVEQKYREYGYKLDDFSKSIISEFHGLKEYCYFILIDENGEKRSCGYDFGFETSGAFDIGTDYELNQIPKELRKYAVPIVSAGFHMPGTVWAVNETLYHTFSYRDDFMKTYHTIFELLEHELKFEYEEVYLTFNHKSLWVWEEINKQNAEVYTRIAPSLTEEHRARLQSLIFPEDQKKD